MTRVVFDTNIYISAMMFGGTPGALLDLAFLHSFTLIISPALLDELDEKLHGKFGVSRQDADRIRVRLASLCVVVVPQESLSVVSGDPDDNRVLECAVTGSADVIVSGDRHLLKLVAFQGISILTARQFLDTASP